MTPRRCLACERPLPPRRRLDKLRDWFLTQIAAAQGDVVRSGPWPFCPQKDHAECLRLMLQRFNPCD